jgi:acetyl-CoA carboxylase biotin carboxyl carrier protein
VAAPAEKAAKPVDVGTLITSPFVGTFYRAPSPEAPPFADVGQSVRKGQVVCIVEAMKLMNEIESEFDGKILEILVKNAEHVEYGQPLFRIEKA